MTDLPRSEYPRPQFRRRDWQCLNGEWEFEIDAGDTGFERGLVWQPLARKIIVPFCPESKLSGIEHVDFMHAVWYRRTIRVPADWAGRQVHLHFGAIDYDATIWADGVEIMRHRGGFTPVRCDLGDVGGRDVTIVVRARDPHKSPMPLGKQSTIYSNHGCHYTRSTGIWQTVWIEPVSATHLKRPRITPDLAAKAFHLELPIAGTHRGCTARAAISVDGVTIATASIATDLSMSPRLTLPIPAGRVRPWSPEDPFLYDLRIELADDAGNVIDAFDSYAGLRSIAIEGKAIKLNGRTVFQRLVLDQGIYPDGIYTAVTDAALKADIDLSLAAGFNGARLHQKVFEERFHYWADKLGYLTWGEFADWGANLIGPPGDNQQPGGTFITQWLEAIERDYSHPSIIGWCPLNETYQSLTDRITVLDDVTRGMFLATKAMDTTRPVLDTSGWAHRERESDVYDNHDYSQDPAFFARQQAGLDRGDPFINPNRPAACKPGEIMSVPYADQPFFCSEFGGIWWNPDAKPGEDSWGYGDRPKTIDAFYDRFDGLCAVLLNDTNMFGYCYTQLTDVFQEQNGIYAFDRKTKFDLHRIRASQLRPAAIEAAKD